jgi:hypothetical protein
MADDTLTGREAIDEGAPMTIRRVTTGHDAQGKAVFVSDTTVDGTTLALLPGAEFHRLWGADVPPRFPDEGAQPVAASYFPPLGGFRFMTFIVAPHTTERRAAVDRHALLAEMEENAPSLPHRRLHGRDDADTVGRRGRARVRVTAFPRQASLRFLRALR